MSTGYSQRLSERTGQRQMQRKRKRSSNIVGGILGDIRGAFDDIGDAFKQVQQVKKITKVVDPTVVTRVITREIPQALETGGNFVADQGELAVTDPHQFIDNTANFALDTTELDDTFVGDAVNEALDVAENPIDTVHGAAEDAGEGAVSEARQLAEDPEQFFDEIGGGIENAADNTRSGIQDAAGSARGGLETAGRATLDGLQSAQRLGEGILEGFTGRLGEDVNIKNAMVSALKLLGIGALAFIVIYVYYSFVVKKKSSSSNAPPANN